MIARRGLWRNSVHFWAILGIGLIFPLISISATLQIDRQTHVLGGDKQQETHYSGSGLLAAAWSGSVCAVAYPDYTLPGEEQGIFMALVGADGKQIGKTIRLNDAVKNDWGYSATNVPRILWDGSAFLILIEKNKVLTLLRVSPAGEIIYEKATCVTLGDNSKFFASVKEKNIYVLRKSSDKSVQLQKLTIEGEIVDKSVNLQIRGEMEQAVFLDSGVAVLTRFSYVCAPDKVMLELFTETGKRINLSTEIPNVSWTPFSALQWNGSSLVCLVANKREEGDVVMRSFQYDNQGKQIGEPQVVGVIPPASYYGSINFDSELIWTGSQYLAAWDQGTPGQDSMEDNYVRLLDDRGVPVSDVLKINPQPLDQANNGSCFTGDGFAVFSVEKGNKNPSLTFTHITVDQLAPAFTPTATPAGEVPTPTPWKEPEIVLPNGSYLLWEGNVSNPMGFFALTIQEGRIEFQKEFSLKVDTITQKFSEPLPKTPVDVIAKVLDGNASVYIVEQPRDWNQYTAKVCVNTPVFSEKGKQKVLFTWKEAIPEPTSTPWPAWEANAPTPTPRSGALKVLWIARKETFPSTDQSGFKMDYAEFGKIFEKFGAQLTWIEVGTQTVSDSLLAGYTAVVFADTRNTPPLTEAEQACVVRYVRGGGSIFIIGQQDSPVQLDKAAIYASSIGQPLGIRFSLRTDGSFINVLEHPLLTGLGNKWGMALGSKLLLEAPAKAIAKNERGDVILAVVEDGYGRAAAFTDESIFYSGEITNRTSMNNGKQLAKNIAAWLQRKEELLTAAPTPPMEPHVILHAKLRTFSDLPISIQGDHVSMSARGKETVELLSSEFSEPLPSYAVNIAVEVAQGDATALIQEHPDPWNGYTAKIILMQPVTNRDAPPCEHYLVITWGKKLTLEPTPTPFPAWAPGAPTPTPAPVAPKILWIAKAGDNPNADGKFDSKLTEFSDMFYALGAMITFVTAGKQPINDALLSGYQAVIFGDTRDVAPLAGAEKESVVCFVRGGASIFVIGQQDDRYIPDPAAIYATSIAEPFGIRFSTSISGAYREFVRHPLTSQLKTVSGMGGSILQVNWPAQALGFAQGGEAILAAAEEGYGRVAAYTDEIAFQGESLGIPGYGLSANSHKQLALNLAAWLLRRDDRIPPLAPEPTATPTFLPGLSDREAQALIQRVFKANEPWLNPKPIKAEYTFKVSLSESEPLAVKVQNGGNTPARVGSILATPLHRMFKGDIPYTVRSLGYTTFQGVAVAALDVDFNDRFQECIGMGGQSHTNYSMRAIGIQACRLQIEPQKAIPLFIGTSVSPLREGQLNYTTTWTFDPKFLAVDGGYAPCSLVSDDPNSFGEKQTFQIASGGVWIFKEGESWLNEESPTLQKGVLVSASISDLKIEDAN